jgi:hypothetical protein
MKRLEDLRSALLFHIVVSLKKANQEQSVSTDQKLAALQDDVRTIVHMFEDPFGNLRQIAARHNDVVEWCVSLSSEEAKPSDIADQHDEELPKDLPIPTNLNCLSLMSLSCLLLFNHIQSVNISCKVTNACATLPANESIALHSVGTYK